MLKKWISLFLVIAMFVPAFAFAGSATFTSETDPYYAYTYPEGWTVLTKSTMDALLELGAAQNEIAGGFLELIKQMGLTGFMSPDNTEFIMVMTQEMGMDIPADLLVSMLGPTLASQAGSMIPGGKLTNEGEILRCGENDFVKIALSANAEGVPINMGIYVVSQNNALFVMYLVATGGSGDMSAFEESLASFTTQK